METTTHKRQKAEPGDSDIDEIFDGNPGFFYR